MRKEGAPRSVHAADEAENRHIEKIDRDLAVRRKIREDEARKAGGSTEKK